MPISKYLFKKYGFHDDAQVPVEFLCEELLMSQREVVPILKEKLRRGQWQREWMRFSVFCLVIDEVLNGCH